MRWEQLSRRWEWPAGLCLVAGFFLLGLLYLLVATGLQIGLVHLLLGLMSLSGLVR